jgi:hypothetical protein
MPQGTPPIKPRHTETVAREHIVSTFLAVLDLTTSKDPRSWGLAAMKLDEAADAARLAERALAVRQECAAAPLTQECAAAPLTQECAAAPLTQSAVHKFLEYYLGDVRPGAHQVRVVSLPAGCDIGRILLESMVRGGGH